MQDRITMKMLEARVNTLNTALGCPTEYWTPCKVDGKWICNPLHFYIGQAYGGGAHDISPRGTKREVWTYVTAMIQGAGYMSIEIHAND